MSLNPNIKIIDNTLKGFSILFFLITLTTTRNGAPQFVGSKQCIIFEQLSTWYNPKHIVFLKRVNNSTSHLIKHQKMAQTKLVWLRSNARSLSNWCCFPREVFSKIILEARVQQSFVNRCDRFVYSESASRPFSGTSFLYQRGKSFI